MSEHLVAGSNSPDAHAGRNENDRAELTGRQGDGRRRCLLLSLGVEEYVIDILKVREIIGMLPITILPMAPACIPGIINLRGRIIPVLDLRLRLGMESIPPSQQTCIIVVEAAGEDPQDVLNIGLVADTVRDVIDLDTSTIECLPECGGATRNECLAGVSLLDGRVALLLDIGRTVQPVFSAQWSSEDGRAA